VSDGPCQIQSGTFLFETQDIQKTIKTYLTNYNTLIQEEALPPNLNSGVMFVNIPNMGPHLACGFAWYGARDAECDRWVKKMAGLAPALGEPDVVSSDPLKIAAAVEAVCPPFMSGTPQTICVSSFSDEVIATIARFAEGMPRLPSCMISLHFLRAVSPSASAAKEAESVYPGREPHIMIEILGTPGGDEDPLGATKWSRDFRNAMNGTDVVQKWSWVPLTAKEHGGLDDMYGRKAQELRDLKKELDPENVFRYALPRM
jgi:hypothetical protein